MFLYESSQKVKQLEKRKGGYYYFTLSAEIVNRLHYQRHSRLLCSIDDKISLKSGIDIAYCGLYYVEWSN